MISFIIVGRNESNKLEKCFNSVFQFIKANVIISAEIIYIDSDSSDNSIEIAKTKGVHKIYRISGNINSAIGRNVGAKQAVGEILFFIDGDMEILPSFFPDAFIDENTIKYDFISGQFVNMFYDKNGNFQFSDEKYKKNINKDHEQTTVGGLFIIYKNLWNSVSGMKEKYKRSHDLDLGLRLAKKGYFLLRKGKIAAYHHTIMYQNKARVWNMFKDKKLFYQNAVLLRDHLFNPYIYRYLIRKEYSFLAIFLSSLLSILSLYAFLIYPSVLLSRSIVNAKKRKTSLGFILFFNLLKDFGFLLFLFTFFPKKPKYQTERIQ